MRMFMSVTLLSAGVIVPVVGIVVRVLVGVRHFLVSMLVQMIGHGDSSGGASSFHIGRFSIGPTIRIVAPATVLRVSSTDPGMAQW